MATVYLILIMTLLVSYLHLMTRQYLKWSRHWVWQLWNYQSISVNRPFLVTTLFWELPLSPSPKLDSSILHLYCLKTTLNRLVLAEASVILGPDLGPDFWGSKFSFKKNISLNSKLSFFLPKIRYLRDY